jgi:hypothetical protein
MYKCAPYLIRGAFYFRKNRTKHTVSTLLTLVREGRLFYLSNHDTSGSHSGHYHVVLGVERRGEIRIVKEGKDEERKERIGKVG